MRSLQSEENVPPLLSGSDLARNTFLNLLGSGLPLLVAAITIPFVIRGLGTARFGILALTWAVLGYFGVFDLGLGRATTKYIAEVLAVGKQTEVSTIVWTAALVQALLGTLGGIFLAVGAPVLTTGILNVPAGLHQETIVGFRVLACAIPAILVSNSFRGALEAGQRFDLVNAVRAPSSAGNFLLPAVGVLLGLGLPGIVALLVLARAVAAMAYYALCVRLFRGMESPAAFRLAYLRTLLAFGGWATVSGVVSPVLVYVDRFIIASLLTVVAVGYYSAPFEIVTRLWIIPSSLVATLFPAFSALSGVAEWERLAKLSARSVKYVLCSVGAVVVLVVVGANEILTLWLGQVFAHESTIVLQILGVGVLFNSLALIPYSLIQAVGRPDIPAKLHLIELPLHLVMVWGLVAAAGIVGAALAWSIRVILDALLLFWAGVKLGHVSLDLLLRGRIPLVLTSLIVLGVGLDLLFRLIPSQPLHMLMLALAGFGIVAMLWRFSLDSRERAEMLGLVKRGRRRTQ